MTYRDANSSGLDHTVLRDPNSSELDHIVLKIIKIRGERYVTLENAEAVIRDIWFLRQKRERQYAERAVDEAWEKNR